MKRQVLIIAEKKSQAELYAKALNCFQKNKSFENEKYVIVWLQGHIFRKETPYDINEKYKKWSINHLPYPKSNKYILEEKTKYLFNKIKEILKNKNIVTIVNGGDCAREGELIQREVINHLPKEYSQIPLKRLWILSLTEETIIEGMNNLLEYEQKDLLYEEALARAEVDLLIGLNYTTLISTYLGLTAKIGRVKTSIMNIIRIRNQSRADFKKETYYIPALKINEIVFEMKDKSQKFSKERAKELLKNISPCLIKEDSKSLRKVSPPKLYNLAKLQGDCAKLYKFKMDKTLSIAQKLYEQYKILSYPRTDSQFITDGELNKLREFFQKTSYIKYKMNLDKRPKSVNKEKVTDHHGFIPIYSSDFENNYKILSSDEKKVMDLVIKNSALQFCDDYQSYHRSVTISAGGLEYSANFSECKELGFKEYTLVEKKESSIPTLDFSNSTVKREILEKHTKIPPLYSVETLNNICEKQMIGQSATRTPIVNELEKEGYITYKDKYDITSLGIAILDNIDIKIKDPNYTSYIEKELEKIRKGELKKEELINKVNLEIMKDIEKYKGKTSRVDINKINSIADCPICKGVIKESKKGGFYCSEKECQLFIPNKYKNAKLSIKNVIKILNGEKITKKLKSKMGKEYSIKIFLEKNKLESSFVKKRGDK